MIYNFKGILENIWLFLIKDIVGDKDIGERNYKVKSIFIIVKKGI